MRVVARHKPCSIVGFSTLFTDIAPLQKSRQETDSAVLRSMRALTAHV